MPFAFSFGMATLAKRSLPYQATGTMLLHLTQLTWPNVRQRVPCVVYFVDPESASSFPAAIGNRMPPCLIDVGPDFVNEKAACEEILRKDFPACVSLVGPRIRLRGVAEHEIENNGKPSFPLIPAGFILLAAALGGQNVQKERLQPTDATVIY